MLMTSAEANKLLNSLMAEKKKLMDKEAEDSVFLAAVGEDVESNRPNYNFNDTRDKLLELESKIVEIKHAINVFNTTTKIPGSESTIDEVLVFLPMQTELLQRLDNMRRKPIKKRKQDRYTVSSIIDYEYINYDIDEVEKEYKLIYDIVTKLRMSLDKVNMTEKFEVNID